MKGVDFPVFKTKRENVTSTFDLNSPEKRKEYFNAKVGAEIEQLKAFLKEKTFIAFLIGKKNTGKGTYSKMFMEIIGKENIGHLSVGDLVRDVHKALADEASKQKLFNFLKENYRGFHSIEETLDLIEGRSQSTLISSELILALVKYEISQRPRQALFIDGFPRAFEQVGYALFLKEILGYQGHPDVFVFIDVPESIIDERIKYRVVCPTCKSPRNLKLLATPKVGWDEEKKEFYLMCDNPSCNDIRMVPKEGDELGIEPIRARLETDDQIFKHLLTLQGIPKIYLRNSVPVETAKEFVDDYELTPSYSYEKDPATGEIKTIEKPWVVKDDNGVDSYSLMPAAVVTGLIKQMADTLSHE